MKEGPISDLVPRDFSLMAIYQRKYVKHFIRLVKLFKALTMD